MAIYSIILSFFNHLFILLLLFYFTILYWFCHTSAWIQHGCTRVPHPEPPSHLPPRTIPLGHPSAPAPSILYLVFLSEKSHEQMSLVGYGAWGCKELDMTEYAQAHARTHTHTHTHTHACTCAKSLQLCLTVCNLMGHSPPGSSVLGLLQARILEWVAMPSFRGSPWPRNWTMSVTSPSLAVWFFTTSATWEAHIHIYIVSTEKYFYKENS